MPRMQHRVELTTDDRTALRALVDANATNARVAKRARALLLTDRSGPRWPDTQVATATGLSVRTVCRLRLGWQTRGREVVQPRGHARGRPKLDDEQSSRILALCQQNPPAGHARWTLRLLATRAVELEIVPELSYETVRRTLKKNGSS